MRQKDLELELLVVEDVDAQDVFLQVVVVPTNLFKKGTLKAQ